ncbi:MAG: glycosyltransferase family 2 protein [Polaribacter sp.]
MEDLKITVFTPTYNRVDLLGVLYESLKKQSYKNFEWVIVDDGSTDESGEFIKKIKKENSLTIIYEKQENQGKHIAINKGVSIANGECFFIVDSDDRLPQKSLEIISEKFNKIRNNSKIAGVVGLRCYFDGNVIGTKMLKNEILCTTLEYRYTHKIMGDRAEVIKTAVLKEYPFPKFGKEKFLSESIVWNKMALKYKLLFFSENIYECEYLNNGLTLNSIRLRRLFPRGAMNLYAELGKIKVINFKIRSKAYINFWRFYFCDLSNASKNLKLIDSQLIAFPFIPLGMILYIKDTLTQKNER